MRSFSTSTRRTLQALANATFRSTGRFAPPGERTIDALHELLGRFGDGAVSGYEQMVRALEHAPRLSHRGRGLSSLTLDEAEAFVNGLFDEGMAQRTLAFLVTGPLKNAYFDDPAIYKELNCTWRFKNAAEPGRHMQQVTDGEQLTGDEEMECHAVVIGTGAGGAVVARELAERGHAVVMLEEGRYHHRDEFTGSAVDAFRTFYRGQAMISALGNAVIPIPLGRMVGGCTAINTGTCWRTPDWVLDGWAKERGLTELSASAMEPYFERVEHELQIGATEAKYLGGVPRLVARGADTLGYKHHPIKRNAPGCDGSGVCDFGCPTDARRSMNVSYVPAALRRGAGLYTSARAERLLVEHGKVVGVVAKTPAGKRVTIRANATIVACGSLLTPLLLKRNGVVKHLRHVGKNLSIHPSTTVSAMFDEDIHAYTAVPQGYAVSEFQREGILLMGATVPIDVAATQFYFAGRRLMDVMERYERVASMGVMVEDASTGFVREGAGGKPQIFYWMGEREQRRMVKGAEILTRIFLAAGAREVYPALHGHRVVRDVGDLHKLSEARPNPMDWLLTAFHPLGTCRMARSPKDGVVDPDHAVFGVPGLYIVDGSVVPSAVAVNPQQTIMAIATRAAERIAQRLEA